MEFQVRVFREPEGMRVLRLTAASAEAASVQARGQGYTVLSPPTAAALGGLRLPGAGRGRFPLLLFSQELLALLAAGMNLVEAFETLAEKEADGGNRDVLTGIVTRLRAGEALSAALAGFADIFPTLYVATVRASERSGGVIDALRRYVTYQEQIDGVKKRVVSAMIYPALLLGVGGLVILFLLTYVVPRFSRIYADRAADMPGLSRLLVEWGGLLDSHGLVLALLAVGLGLAAAVGLSQPSARARLAAWLWRIPAAGEHLRLYQLARFYRTLGMLLRGGSPVPAALALVPGLLGPSLRPGLAAATRRIEEGLPLSEALAAHGLTTPVAARLLRVGERTGEMHEMMERIAAFHDEEIARRVDLLTKTFEPLLMAVIGLIIGAVVVLMYLPIFDLVGSIR